MQKLWQQSKQYMFFSFFLLSSWSPHVSKNVSANNPSNHAGFITISSIASSPDDGEWWCWFFYYISISVSCSLFFILLYLYYYYIVFIIYKLVYLYMYMQVMSVCIYVCINLIVYRDNRVSHVPVNLLKDTLGLY